MLFHECLSALARKLLKLCQGARGRHQCVLWHRGDPAGRTWHESLGIRFNPISARKVEDLRELLLRTPLFYVLYLAPVPNIITLSLCRETHCIIQTKRQTLTCLITDSQNNTNDSDKNFFKLTLCLLKTVFNRDVTCLTNRQKIISKDNLDVFDQPNIADRPGKRLPLTGRLLSLTGMAVSY